SKHDAAINRFFPTAFTFARRLYDALPVSFDHDWCGVTQLGWDEKSQQKIAQMLSLALPAGLASALNAEEAEQAVGVTTRCGGITYPAGGWLCPEQLTRAVIALATEQGLQTRFCHTLTSLVAQESRWQLRFTSGETASHETVVLANGHQINRFDQTRPL
ncbi:FAD-dependent oxidoreductase, partial [Salmonella enterica subsp. enterica serovar Indiana]|nr:FAD-dependent oxidoreductase [Salmonella enterica subsp. enterica serovar Indiana]